MRDMWVCCLILAFAVYEIEPIILPRFEGEGYVRNGKPPQCLSIISVLTFYPDSAMCLSQNLDILSNANRY